MERLTKPTIGCFAYDLKDHEHISGEFSTYEAFFNYNMAVRKLGEYEKTGLTPEEIKGMVKVVRCGECENYTPQFSDSECRMKSSGTCGLTNGTRPEQHFCGWGKRRSE